MLEMVTVVGSIAGLDMVAADGMPVRVSIHRGTDGGAAVVADLLPGTVLPPLADPYGPTSYVGVTRWLADEQGLYGGALPWADGAIYAIDVPGDGVRFLACGTGPGMVAAGVSVNFRDLTAPAELVTPSTTLDAMVAAAVEAYILANPPSGGGPHAASHGAGGADAVSLTSAQLTDLTETVQDIASDLSPTYTAQVGDGDQMSGMQAWLDDPTRIGVRRLRGHIKVSGKVIVPAGVAVDARGATIEQVGTGKTTIELSAGARIIGGTLQGKTSDYVAGTATPVAIGMLVNGAGVTVDGTSFTGFAGAAVKVSANSARLVGLRIDGVHGKLGITIPAVDPSCFGIYADPGPDLVIEDLEVKNCSIGVITSLACARTSIGNVRVLDIPGQHGLYLQSAEGLRVGRIAGERVNLNLVKVQLSDSAPDHTYGSALSDITGREIGDTVLVMVNASTALATAKKLYDVTIANVTGHNSHRVLYLGSIRGGSASNIVGDTTGTDCLTLIDCQDLSINGLISRGSGWGGIRLSTGSSVGATGAASQRIRLTDIGVYNPGATGVAADQVGIALGGDSPNGDGTDILIDGCSIVSDNGQMRYAIAVNPGLEQESLRVRNTRQSGATVNSFNLASATRYVAEWSNVDPGGLGLANFPTSLPIRCGSVGQRTRYAIAGTPTKGVYSIGDVIDNTTPAASGAPGWVITNAGGLYSGTWAASTAYTVGTWLRAATSGRVVECTVAGTSGGTEPSWSAAAVGATFTDGGATWIIRATALGTAKAMATVSA